MANVLMIGNGRSDQTTGLLFEALAEKLRHEHTVDLVLKQGPGGAWRKVVHVLKVNLPQLKKVARSEVLVVHTAAALSIQEVLFARALRKRIVVFLWDVYPDSTVYMNGGRKTISTILFGVLEKIALRRADKILVPNADYSAYPSVRKLPNVNEFAMWPPQALAQPVRSTVRRDGTLRIGFSGQINAIRDLHSAILNIASQVDTKVEFHLFSNDRLVLRPDRAPIPPNVSVVERGFLPESALTEAMSSLDAGLISVDPEFPLPAFPSKVFAYVSSGIPIIFYGPQNSSSGRIVEETGIGLVLKSSSKATLEKELKQIRDGYEAARERFLAMTELNRGRLAQIL